MRASGYAAAMSQKPAVDLMGLSAVEFAEPTEVRIQRGLDKPVAQSSPGSMQLGAINKITQTRLRWALSELTARNLEKVSAWLDELAKASPKAAIESLVEIMKFVTPQQKQMTVESSNPGAGERDMKTYTLAELQGLVLAPPEDRTVSEQ